MERIGSGRAEEQNGDGTIDAGRTDIGRAGAARAVAVTVAVFAAATLTGCSVTVQPKNAAATSPLSSSPTPSAASGSAPSTSAASTSASPTVTPSDADHPVCVNVREALATLKTKLEADKDSDSRTGIDYHAAGTALRTQDSKTDNADLRAALKTLGIAYQAVGRDATNHESTDADLAKVTDDLKPVNALCAGGSSSDSSSGSSSSSE